MTTPTSQPQEASQATTILILGILGLVVCGLLGPVAWYMGNQELAAIDAGRRPAEGRSNANIGRILGMVTSGLMILGIVVGGLLLIVGVASS